MDLNVSDRNALESFPAAIRRMKEQPTLESYLEGWRSLHEVNFLVRSPGEAKEKTLELISQMDSMLPAIGEDIVELIMADRYISQLLPAISHSPYDAEFYQHAVKARNKLADNIASAIDRMPFHVSTSAERYLSDFTVLYHALGALGMRYHRTGRGTDIYGMVMQRLHQAAKNIGYQNTWGSEAGWLDLLRTMHWQADSKPPEYQRLVRYTAWHLGRGISGTENGYNYMLPSMITARIIDMLEYVRDDNEKFPRSRDVFFDMMKQTMLEYGSDLASRMMRRIPSLRERRQQLATMRYESAHFVSSLGDGPVHQELRDYVQSFLARMAPHTVPTRNPGAYIRDMILRP